MTDKKFTEMKEIYVEHLIDIISETGELYPHITIFADVIHPEEDDKDKPAIIHIPIPEGFMENDESKEDFVENVLPDVFKKLKKEFIPQGIAWSSEAWMRTVKKDADVPDNYKDLPIKKEIVIVMMSTKDKEEVLMYEIKRKGKQVNSDGNLVDIVKLNKIKSEQPNSISGRFSGLFKKFND